MYFFEGDRVTVVNKERKSYGYSGIVTSIPDPNDNVVFVKIDLEENSTWFFASELTKEGWN